MDPERIAKQFSGVDLSGLPGGVASQIFSQQQVPALAVWAGINAVEQQWLQHNKLNVMPPTNAVAQSLSQVPEIDPPLLNWERLDGISGVAQKVVSVLTQATNMVETVAEAMASPLADIARIGEELAGPVQGWQQLVNNIPSFWNFESFWEGLQPALQGFAILLEDAEAGREVLRASEYGFADHFWGIFYVRGFAHIDARVRDAVVTRRLASYTSSEEFVEQLGTLVRDSKLMCKRWRIIEPACEAHAARKYDLAVPAILAQIEGTLVSLMFLKDLVKKENGKFFLVNENGDFKLSKKGKNRLALVTLQHAITNAKLDEHPNLAAASEFIADTLIQRRNNVLHGHDLNYGKAKFSVQALLILAVLAEAVSELASGNASPSFPH